MVLNRLFSGLVLSQCRGIRMQPVSIPPRLKHVNGFLLDRRQGERKLLEEFKPNGEKSTIRIEVPDLKDRSMVGQAFVEHFNNACGMFSCLKMTYDDLSPWCFELLDTLLHKDCSVVAFDNDKLVGFILNTYHTPDEFPEMYYRGKMHEDNPVFEIKHDYSEDIDEGPYASRKANQMWVALEELYSQTGRFLPKDIQKLGIAEAGGVHPNYLRGKLFARMMELSEELCRKKGCDYFAGYTVATGSYEYCKKKGFETIFKLPYRNFKDNGHIVFDDLPDGCESMQLQLLKL